MPRGEPSPPRPLRAAGLQAAVLVAGLLLAGHKRADPPRQEPKPAPKREEKRIRVVQVPRPKPEPTAHSPTPSPPKAATPTPPKVASIRQPPPAPSAPARSPSPATPRPQIAANATSVQGVHLRVLVPSSASELLAHLRNSGGCLVVSQLDGDAAEVLSVLDVSGARAVETRAQPCDGVPRLVRDAALNQALGDPIGRARAALPAGERRGEVVLQVLLSRRLQDEAQSALRARFGPVSMEEIGKLAAASGTELTCFGEPAGALRCQSSLH